MPTDLLTASDDLLVALRGAAALRPAVDRGVAGGLRAWLDDGLFELLGVVAPGAVRLTTSSLAPAPSAGGATALLRGAMVAQLVRLRVAGHACDDRFDAACRALRGSGRDDDLVAVLDELGDEDRAMLAADVEAHGAVLEDRLPSLPARWSPRCGVRQAISLAGGGVVLRGLVDLTLGAPGGARSSVCLVEVTTSRLEPRHELVLGYLALLETLRVGEPPLRVAALSTSDGTAVVREVIPALLATAVDTVFDAVRALALT